MRWHLKYPPDKVDFLEARAIQTGKTDQALLDRPDIPERLVPFWETFWILHPTRSIGMAAGAIRIGDMVEYLRLLGYRGDDELRRGVMRVCALDRTWRQWNDEQNKS